MGWREYFFRWETRRSCRLAIARPSRQGLAAGQGRDRSANTESPVAAMPFCLPGSLGDQVMMAVWRWRGRGAKMTRRRNGPVGHLFSWAKVKISFGPHFCLALMKVLYLDQYNARANATATFKHANENNQKTQFAA